MPFLVLSAVLVACESQTLIGPDAQRAAARATPLLHTLPEGTVVLLNGARLAPGRSLEGLDPANITRIEIVKAGDFPSAGQRHPVIRISTTDSAFVDRVTVH
jgi:hypothetical protein